MDFNEVIHKRRSSRRFSPEPIPEEIINELIESARLAPSGGNAQNWVFGIIKDNTTKERLAKNAGNQEWIATAPVIIACCAKLEGDLKAVPNDDFGLLVNKTRFGEDFVTYLNDYPDRKTVNTFWNNAVPLIPGEHIFLAAVNRGLNACWVGYLDIIKAGEILALPEDIVCLFLMPIGYTNEKPKEIKRKNKDKILFHEKWS